MHCIVRYILLAGMLFMLSACNLAYMMKEDFERTTKSYATMLRWQEFDAAVAYVDAPLRDEYRKRIEAAKGIKVLDSRVLSTECRTDRKEGHVTMELDYYIAPSNKVKTVTDVQDWRYLDEDSQKGWRLKSLLPEFK